MKRFAVFVAIGLIVACSSSSNTDQDAGGSVTDGGSEMEASVIVVVDATPDVQDAGDASVTADADAESSAPDGGYTYDGGAKCCLQGQGIACCQPDDLQCFPYGHFGQCQTEGKSISAYFACSTCCDGLSERVVVAPGNAVPPSADNLPEGCDETDAPGVKVCIKCGDGICGSAENWCNCPADCPKPDAG